MRLTGFVIAMHKKIRRLPSGKQRKEYIQFVEKVCFFKKCLFSIPIPKPLSPGKGNFTGATAPNQARMLAVSHTKPLHDAVAQMADDLYVGYAPATPFFKII